MSGTTNERPDGPPCPVCQEPMQQGVVNSREEQLPDVVAVDLTVDWVCENQSCSAAQLPSS